MTRMKGHAAIRGATRQDVPGIGRLQRRWAQEKITHGFRPASPVAIRRALGEWCYVAEINGRLIGFVAGGVRVSDGLAVVTRGRRYLEIDDLYVAVSHRNRGVGHLLMNAITGRARQRGIRYLTAYSSTKDAHRILRFYERHGFASWFVQVYRRL